MRNWKARGGGGQREATAGLEGGEVPPFGGAFVVKDAPAVAAGFGPFQFPVRGYGTVPGCASPAVRRGCAARGLVREVGVQVARLGGAEGVAGEDGRDLPHTCAIYICKE